MSAFVASMPVQIRAATKNDGELQRWCVGGFSTKVAGALRHLLEKEIEVFFLCNPKHGDDYFLLLATTALPG